MAATSARPSMSELVQPLATQLMRPALLGAGMLAVGAAMPPDWVMHGPQLCIFKIMSGIPCPGCGLTRSVVLLMHGDVSGSLFFHPLGVVFVLGAMVLAAVDLFGWWRSRRAGRAPLSPSWLLDRIAQTPAAWVLVGVLMALWAVRLPLYLTGNWVY